MFPIGVSFDKIRFLNFPHYFKICNEFLRILFIRPFTDPTLRVRPIKELISTHHRHVCASAMLHM